MIMTDEEIVRDYKQAKDGLKQAKILADQNLCTKEEIVKILLDQGVKVDGRLLQKGKRHASPGPKPKPEPQQKTTPEPKPEPEPQQKTTWLPWPGPQQKKQDAVNHPAHYTRGGIECIDAIAAAIQDLPGKEAWLVGQVIKYVWRYKWKNGVEDLNKARFYLDRLIEELGQ